MTSDITSASGLDRADERDTVERESSGSRRALLGVLGAVGVGAVAATVGGARPASATATVFDGGTTDGVEGITSGNGQSGVYGHTTAAGAFGVTGISNNGDGVQGFSNSPSKAGVYGWSTVSGVHGVTGYAAAGNGVVGTTDSLATYGVRATNTNSQGTGLRADGGGSGIQTYGSAYGILANVTGPEGVAATAVVGQGGYGVGARLFGAYAQLYLGGEGAPPISRPAPYISAGHLVVDYFGDLWFNTSGGVGVSAGWRKLAGFQSAGAFHPVTPFRAYDSRQAAPTPGILANGTDRKVNIANARHLDTGNVVIGNVVPEHATAVTYNITVTASTVGGFLAVTPGDETAYAASTINFGTGQNLANGGVVKLNATRDIRVFAGGGGNTHFIVDITGYYI